MLGINKIKHYINRDTVDQLEGNNEFNLDDFMLMKESEPEATSEVSEDEINKIYEAVKNGLLFDQGVIDDYKLKDDNFKESILSYYNSVESNPEKQELSSWLKNILMQSDILSEISSDDSSVENQDTQEEDTQQEDTQEEDTQQEDTQQEDTQEYSRRRYSRRGWIRVFKLGRSS